MQKKQYIQPTLELHPYRTQIALCSGGGDIPAEVGGGINGGKSWDDGRAPRRTKVF